MNRQAAAETALGVATGIAVGASMVAAAAVWAWRRWWA